MSTPGRPPAPSIGRICRLARVLRFCSALSWVQERLEFLALVLIGLGYSILHLINGGSAPPPPPSGSA